MTALRILALLALVGAAGLGFGTALHALAPDFPADLRGFSAAGFTLSAAALLIEEITA